MTASEKQRAGLEKARQTLIARAEQKCLAAEVIMIEQTADGVTPSDRSIAELLHMDRVKVRALRKALIAEGRLTSAQNVQTENGRVYSMIRLPAPQVVLSEAEAPLATALVRYQGQRGPLQTRPEVMLVNADHYAHSTRKSIMYALNRISRSLWDVDYNSDQAHWEQLNTYPHARLVLKLLTIGERSPQTIGLQFSFFKELLKTSADLGHVTPEDLYKCLRIKPPKLVQRRKFEDPPTPDEIARILDQIPLSSPVGIMHLAQMALLYPCGLRSSDISAMRRADLDTLDKGYLIVWRRKTDIQSPLFIGPFRGVKAVLRKWLAMLPPGDALWYMQADWGRPVIEKPREGSQSYRLVQVFKRYRDAAGVRDFVTGHRARHLIETAAIGKVDGKVVNTHLAHGVAQMDIHYVLMQPDNYADIFRSVPELMAIDAKLLSLIDPNAPADYLERRYCWNCGSDISGHRSEAVVCREDRCKKAHQRGRRTGPKGRTRGTLVRTNTA